MRSGFVVLLCLVFMILANVIRSSIADSNLGYNSKPEEYWGSDAFNILSNASVPFSDSYFYTIWGQCQYELKKLGNNVNTKNYTEKVLKIKSPLYEVGYMSIRLAELNSKKKAPLMFYYPGAFSSANDSSSDQFVEEFTKLGFHVVVFPNPWSTDYISHNPYFYLGDFIREGDAHYKLFKDTLIELANISSGEIHLSGVSYGALLASMTGAMDANSDSPKINKEITLISPPYHLKRTLIKLDNLIYDNKNEFVNYTKFDLMLRVLPVCSQSGLFPVPQYVFDNSQGAVAYVGFHEYLVESIVLQDKLKNINAVPDREEGMLSLKFNDWKNHLSFKSFIRSSIPSVIDYMDTEKANILYWTDILITKSKKVRILTSNDDFLNDENVWDLSQPFVFRLDHGGHFGFRSEKWFYQFIQKAFTSFTI